jgi:hypothetical protein
VERGLLILPGMPALHSHPRFAPSDEAIRRRLTDGVLAGLAATLVMTALVLAAPALGGGAMPEAAARALAGLRPHPLLAFAALALHFGYGSLAGGLFAVSAKKITVGRGMIYGLGLWLLAVTLYAPLGGLGFFVAHEPAIALLALPAHLLYGAALGASGPRGEIVHPLCDRRPEPPPARSVTACASEA